MIDQRELYIHFSMLNGTRIEMTTRSGQERDYHRPTRSTMNRIQALTWSGEYVTGIILMPAIVSGLASQRVCSITIEPRRV